MSKVLVIATSRKTRGGITSVIKAHETGEQWKKYHCHWVQTHRDGPSWRKIIYLVLAWIDFIFRVPFVDIVHVHGASGASARRKMGFMKVSKFLRKKVIYHFHPSTEKLVLESPFKEISYQALSIADKVLVLSPQWIRWINKAFPGNKIDMQVMWNPCPTVNRNSSNKKKQILYAGTILGRKGYAVLLGAFGKIAKKYPEWKVAFAGNPYLLEGINEMDDGKRIADELGITNQVEWLGWVAGAEKERVFNESSIYCLASDGEGFPMGVLDAWAYGIPCVMTPVGGIPDIVEDGKSGLITPVGDVNALASALERLMMDSNLRVSMVNETDIWVNGEFSSKVINNKLGEVYASII